MENIKHSLDKRLTKRLRLWILLFSTLVIITISILAYNRITYEFPLAVGNTGQSALGSPTSAGVGIVIAMIVFASILGFGAALSIFGSVRKMSDRIGEIVARELSPKDSTSASQKEPEWEDSSMMTTHKATDDEILNALWHSKEKRADSAE